MTPEEADDIDRHPRLWQAVVARLAMDAMGSDYRTSRKDMTEARAWFRTNSRDFQNTCHLANMDPQAVRDRVLPLIEKAKKAEANDPQVQAQQQRRLAEIEARQKADEARRTITEARQLKAELATEREALRLAEREAVRLKREQANAERETLRLTELKAKIEDVRRKREQVEADAQALKAERHHPDLYEAHGKTLTLAEWAKELGVEKETLRMRLRNRKEGAPLESVFVAGTLTNQLPKHFVTVDGERLSLIDLAERTGIKYATLQFRLKAGWPDEDIAKPIGCRGRVRTLGKGLGTGGGSHARENVEMGFSEQ